MKKIIINIQTIAGAFGSLFYPVAVIMAAALFVLIGGDIAKGWMQAIDPNLLNASGLWLGRTGMMSVIIALSYYIIRTINVYLTTRETAAPIWVKNLLKQLVSILRPIHPVFGVLAFVLLSAHGYIIFFKIYGIGFEPLTATGWVAFAVLFALAMPGLILKRDAKKKRIRSIHRILGISLALGFVIHRIIIALLR